MFHLTCIEAFALVQAAESAFVSGAASGYPEEQAAGFIRRS